MSVPDSSDPKWARLEKYLATSEPNTQGWYDAYCPLHDDDKRSAGFNFRKDLWSCRARCGSGSLTELVARLKARDDNDFVPISSTGDVIDIATRKKRTTARRQNRPAPDDGEIRGWVARLQEDPELLSKFTTRRGLTAETLRKFGIGWSDEDRAYSIPVWNAEGELVNIRLYRIEDEAGTTKIWSWGGEGMDASAIYPESVLKENSTILVCEGEWDALMANQVGIPAVTGTTGAKQWMSKWNRKFSGKDVYICYDRDEAGDEGAEKVARNLDGTAHLVAIVELPVEWREKHGLDITDFLYKLGKGADDLRAAMSDARVTSAPKDGEAVPVSVRESFNPSLATKPMDMVVSVVGKGTTKHLIPRTVTFSCNMNAEKHCPGCPMLDAGGLMKREIPASDPVVLRLRDVPEKVRDEALREFIEARKCGKMSTHVTSLMTTELLVVRNSIEHADEEESNNVSRTIVNVGQYATEANRIVRVTGTTYPTPREQESQFQAWDLRLVESSLDTYEVSPEDVELMKRFRPARRQSPLNKMQMIALDLADNVTGIVGRPLLHMALDLVWHSALSFDFDGRTEERGWLELLVVGDGRTGKSLVATELSRHFGFGKVVSCESASIPGLLGAVKPMPGGKAWTLEWGAIPLNDRRLVVLDEAAGLTTDQIGQLSSVRSSGRAEIIKAETEVTNARTRLIWLSNPRDNIEGMKDFTYGVQAIQPLIGNQEDIARFDFAMTVAESDVKSESINRRQEARRSHVYTKEACHALVRWVWSRKREDVVWTREAEDAVYSSALDLGKRYVPDPPLIQAQNVRVKLARMAVAVAARMFSTDETHTKIVVNRVHVEAAVKLLDYIYGTRGFGYKEISERRREKDRKAVKALDQINEYLQQRPGLARFLIDCGGRFRRQQMEEMLNYDREEANLVIMKLNSANMVKSASEWDYRVMPLLHALLRDTKE